MGDKKCAGCASLQAELARVKAERDRLQRLLAAVQDRLYRASSGTTAEMSAGDVPQGRYGYLKGQNDLAADVLKILGEHGARPVKHSSGMFSGLFRKVW